MEKTYNTPASSFWTARGDTCTVLGDVLGRIPAINMLSPKVGETVLDVGSGAGWCTRRLARTGAKVVAFEVASEMLAAAVATEQKEPLGIEYWQGDLTEKWQVADQSVDAVSCIAVLMHVDPEGVQFFFSEAKRVLRPGGRLVVSLSHREVLRQQEVTGLAPGWIWHEPGMWDADKNALAVEHYFDAAGQEFVTPTWMHNLRPAAEKAGFKVAEHHDRAVTRESLVQIYGERSAKWPTGYAAFEQILAY